MPLYAFPFTLNHLRYVIKQEISLQGNIYVCINYSVNMYASCVPLQICNLIIHIGGAMDPPPPTKIRTIDHLNN